MPLPPEDWTRFKRMAAKISTIEMRENLPNDARPDSSVYRIVANTFPGASWLPRLRRLVYVAPDLDQDVCLELECLLTPSLADFSFSADEPISDRILERLASTCREVRALAWKKQWFTTPLSPSLAKFSTLDRLDVNWAELNNENVGIISTLSSLTLLEIAFDLDWHKQRTGSLNHGHRILGNLETLKISGLNEDIFAFIGCLNGSRLDRLVVSLMWEAQRPSSSSFRDAISSLKTLSLKFNASNRPDDPIDVEKLLEPFGHATTITKLSIKLFWWTQGDTLDKHLSELLKNFPLLESLTIKFVLANCYWADMGSLQLMANAAKYCPKLKRMRFKGNINPALLEGPVMDSFADLEDLDLSGSRAMDRSRRPVEVDQGKLKEFIQSIAPGLSMDHVRLDCHRVIALAA